MKLSAEFPPHARKLNEIKLEKAAQTASTENNGKKKKELLALLYLQIQKTLIKEGATLITDVNQLYQKYNNKQILVRRGDLIEMVKSLKDQGGIKLGFDPKLGFEYNNCALWSNAWGTRGLENAFVEGWSETGGIVAVLGFRQGDNLQMKKLKENLNEPFTIDRSGVRCASGVVTKKDLEFILVRVPADRFPKVELTEHDIKLLELAEGNDKPEFVFRAFAF